MEMLVIYIIISLLIGFGLCYFFVKNTTDSNTNMELRKELREMNSDSTDQLRKMNANSTDQLRKTLESLGNTQTKHLDDVSRNIEKLKEGNEKKLDQMREVVDEKLQTTLEKRIGESFKLVSERLEAVQLGLGQMQTLATDVGGLKKVLTNVSSRGALGEIQAEQILQNILNSGQYEKNVKTHPACKGQVEFAIKLPGRSGNLDSPIWLPIDCKFPKEDYERLIDSYDSGEKDEIKKAIVKFKSNVTGKARTIRNEYVSAPYTTEFAVMFLPTEGLYAEVVRHPGLFESLQRDHQIVVTGPSTLAAFVNSLQMGFKTLALETNASEVYNVLGAVKTEFVKFTKMMTLLHKQLNTAANTISNEKGDDSMMRRLRAMEGKLKDVESLPSSKSNELLDLPEKVESKQQKF
jgi:DNA recombination protein RmuC|tara:strand:- start:105 stop:1325 length:1221 start_codon:yes stop_codon:yes gene_type:complete